MAAKFTPRLVELTYEAALKSYWRKEALKNFLRASHISENFLATWGGEESKRDFLDKVFHARFSSDWTHLVSWEELASQAVRPPQVLSSAMVATTAKPPSSSNFRYSAASKLA